MEANRNKYKFNKYANTYKNTTVINPPVSQAFTLNNTFKPKPIPKPIIQYESSLINILNASNKLDDLLKRCNEIGKGKLDNQITKTEPIIKTGIYLRYSKRLFLLLIILFCYRKKNSKQYCFCLTLSFGHQDA